MVQAVFNLKTSEKQIGIRIRTALKQEVNSYLAKHIKEIRDQTRLIVKSYITGSAEFQKMIGGKLQTELGVIDPDSDLAAIVDIWIKSIHIVTRPARKWKDGVQAGFRLLGIQGDWDDVLGTSSAEYTTVKGSTIPWLEWMLKGGSSIIVRDYDVAFGYPTVSRTGDAIMVDGSGWSVPLAFSGTTTDNFATRAIDTALPDIENMILTELKS